MSNCISPSLKSSIPLQSQFCKQIVPSGPNKNTSTMYTFAPRDGDRGVLFSMTKMIPRKKPKYSALYTLRQSVFKISFSFLKPWRDQSSLQSLFLGEELLSKRYSLRGKMKIHFHMVGWFTAVIDQGLLPTFIVSFQGR